MLRLFNHQLVVLRILSHFFNINKKEMSHGQTHFRYRSTVKALYGGKDIRGKDGIINM